MPYQPLPARLITIAGYQPMLTALWDGCYGPGKIHAARTTTADLTPAGLPEPPLPELRRGWVGICEHCSEPVPWDDPGTTVRIGGTVMRRWKTASGKPEPGDLYWTDDYAGRCFHWDNCPGRHLHAVLPNGHPWDIDSRAANCNRPTDRVHRCWVRTGEPPLITAGKSGDTCSAGAGSIAAGDYHGFLTDGVFTAG
jgi:hypothetical protein